MVETLVREPERKERKLLQMVHNVLDDIALRDDAERYIEDLAIKSVSRVRFDRVDQARALEAEANFRMFAETLRKYALEQNKKSLGRNDVEAILKYICPIYPIC